ncbi:MAG: helix-turn-helix domain-containing protein [Actinomycetaceae bacterium]|nr:helix-turn-helix domain-containing protein [Actinomycetaceae bacterium]MDY6082676.1 helix-turn-helix domain-containing protein [Actinomycetaceae bacterium]
MAGESPKFYTVAEVASLARVSRMTVYRMIHSGELPAIRFGSSYRVPASAMESIVTALEVEDGFGEGRAAGGR